MCDTVLGTNWTSSSSSCSADTENTHFHYIIRQDFMQFMADLCETWARRMEQELRQVSVPGVVRVAATLTRASWKSTLPRRALDDSV